MSGNSKLTKLGLLTGFFLTLYFVPFEHQRVTGAILEAFYMLADYAREHVLLCLIPALFIAGAISVFLNQQAVIKYLGPKAKPVTAYSVASVSGTILAVCSCAILPLFKGIYKKGAGLGPAIAFLYSGPAINVLAIVLTAKVLGWKIGLARAVGAIFFAAVIGLLMHLIFKKSDEARLTDERMFTVQAGEERRSLLQNSLYMVSMIGILIFINWAGSRGSSAVWDAIYSVKYYIAGAFGLALVFMLWKWFNREEIGEWGIATRDFALQIIPLLFAGVFVAGFFLGRPGHEGVIPGEWVASLVGGNSLAANFFASISGALMYFATLTEVPILQGLIGAGMGQGPALALLLAGPSLSLPSILVIASEIGWKKTLVYVGLVSILSTLVGYLYGLYLA
ncbi:MAG TPA: permease [Firmicutes bacterium]|nr:permease [Bacillota bacterium]